MRVTLNVIIPEPEPEPVEPEPEPIPEPEPVVEEPLSAPTPDPIPEPGRNPKKKVIGEYNLSPAWSVEVAPTSTGSTSLIADDGTTKPEGGIEPISTEGKIKPALRKLQLDSKGEVNIEFSGDIAIPEEWTQKYENDQLRTSPDPARRARALQN